MTLIVAKLFTVRRVRRYVPCMQLNMNNSEMCDEFKFVVLTTVTLSIVVFLVVILCDFSAFRSNVLPPSSSPHDITIQKVTTDKCKMFAVGSPVLCIVWRQDLCVRYCLLSGALCYVFFAVRSPVLRVVCRQEPCVTCFLPSGALCYVLFAVRSPVLRVVCRQELCVMCCLPSGTLCYVLLSVRSSVLSVVCCQELCIKCF
jgi:hypothetical protein